MKTKKSQKKPKTKLPEFLQPFFWDDDFDSLTWEDDREFITARVLSSGDWRALTWLRSRAGDGSLREWIERHEGRGLGPERLRFWQIVLGLPRRQVNIWLAAERQTVWERRVNP